MLTQNNLLNFIRENPDHALTVDVDNDGQLVIYTGLRVNDDQSNFEPMPDPYEENPNCKGNVLIARGIPDDYGDNPEPLSMYDCYEMERG